MLSPAIMAPRDLILDTVEAQRIALFFDQILTWPLDRQDLSKEESTRLQAELEYLASERLVVRCGFQMPSIISFGTADGGTWDPFAFSAENCELILPFEAVTSIPKHDDSKTHADRVVRHVSSQLYWSPADSSDTQVPLVAHAHAGRISTETAAARAMELTIRSMPMPPEDLPWQDLLQFRRESENVSLLRKFRIWVQKQSLGGTPPSILFQELESLLEDYRKYMAIQHKKYGEGIVSTIIVAAVDAVTELMNMKPGSAMRGIIDIRARRVALTESELAAPGREIAYVARAQDYLRGK